MRMLTLGRTGQSVSAISLGTWSYGGLFVNADKIDVGWQGHDIDAAKAAIRSSFEAGVNHWDTADVYGDGESEILLGMMLKEIPRDKVFLASKVGWDRGAYSHFYHPDLMRERVERSLRNLGTDVLDLYYLHHCLFGKNGEYFDSALEMMHRFKDEGKIKYIGLSDWNLKTIMTYIERCSPDVVQPYRCVLDDTYVSSGLKAYVDKHNLGVAFFSPLKHGLLLGKYTSPPEFPKGDFRAGVKEFQNQNVLDKVIEAKNQISTRFGDHPLPLHHALLGVLYEDAPTACTLVGMRNAEQTQEWMNVGETLSAEDATWVRALYR